MTAKHTYENYDTKSDEELARLSVSDVDAFYLLIKRYEPKFLRYIGRMTGGRQDKAEDILQEIFIKVYRNLNSFNPKLLNIIFFIVKPPRSLDRDFLPEAKSHSATPYPRS